MRMRLRFWGQLTRTGRCKRLSLILALSLFLIVILIGRSDFFLKIKRVYIRVFHGYIGQEENVQNWMTDIYQGCGGHFTGYGGRFALLTNVTMMQSNLQFYIPCSKSQYSNLRYSFLYGTEGTHMNEWMNNKISPLSISRDSKSVVVTRPSHDLSEMNKLVILVQRYEFANMYHQTTDLYNVFLVAKLLNVPIENVTVLLVGKNINGPIDPIWDSLYGPVFYTEDIKEPVTIPKLAWNILGYESPVNYVSRQTLPFVDDFKAFVLNRHSVNSNKQLNCDHLRIAFLFRRDYVTHAGNKEGKVSRKIQNEDELLTVLKEDYPTAKVEGIQFDRYTFKQQLEIVTDTDLFIGMHGAGLVHILFLPQHAAVLELYPIYWFQNLGVLFFRAMARWRKLKYAAWQNLNPYNEYPDKYTYIPTSALRNNVRNLYEKICPKNV